CGNARWLRARVERSCRQQPQTAVRLRVVRRLLHVGHRLRDAASNRRAGYRAARHTKPRTDSTWRPALAGPLTHKTWSPALAGLLFRKRLRQVLDDLIELRLGSVGPHARHLTDRFFPAVQIHLLLGQHIGRMTRGADFDRQLASFSRRKI